MDHDDRGLFGLGTRQSAPWAGVRFPLSLIVLAPSILVQDAGLRPGSRLFMTHLCSCQDGRGEGASLRTAPATQLKPDRAQQICCGEGDSKHDGLDARRFARLA